MSRRRLATPDQPAVVRALLAAYEFCASLQFAVVLIALLAVVLGLGTFVESGFGTEAVKFGVWNTWWFTLLNALLAVSIFCAAAIRFPWKRHQTGFVITHIGLLVLLAGCLMSQRGGLGFSADRRIAAGFQNHCLQSQLRRGACHNLRGTRYLAGLVIQN